MDDARCIQPVRIERDMFERKWWGGLLRAEGERLKLLPVDFRISLAVAAHSNKN
jgi:hypothetical protein